MRLLLDTNAYSAWMRGHPGLVERVKNAEHLLLSTVVVGELLHGFHGGTRYVENRRELDRLLEHADVTLLPVTLATAEYFGRITHALRRAGTPIPTNDIWIAAHAMEHAAEFASFDEHFEKVAGLVWTRMMA